MKEFMHYIDISSILAIVVFCIEAALLAILRNCECLRAKPDDVIIRQGDQGDRYA